MDSAIILLVVILVTLIIRFGPSLWRKMRVEEEIATLNSIIMKKKVLEVYAVAVHFKYLTKVEGFQAVLTLLKHRHRARALKRLDTFVKEWEENGLKLYNRK